MLIQFEPCRAKKKLTIDELEAKHLSMIAEQKIDGERYLVQTNAEYDSFLHGVTSRRQSEITGRFVEKHDRVPHIANHPQLPPKSMFDCEFVSSGDAIYRELPASMWDKLLEPNHPHMLWLRKKYDGHIPIYPHVSNTVSIMGSLPALAVSKQKERGLIWAYTFDMILYQGQNLTQNGQMARRKFLAKHMEEVDPEIGMVLMPAWINLTLQELEFFFYFLTDAGTDGEGIILKPQNEKYNAASNWFKLKRDWPCDVVYTGGSKVGEHGITGKMFGYAASLEIGVYHHNMLFPIGWVSGIRQGFAHLQTPDEHRISWAGKAIECRHNGLQKDPSAPLGYTLRHPRFRRERADKNPTDCTWEALYAEASKKLD